LNERLIGIEASNGDTVVEHLTHRTKVKGLNPDYAACAGREKTTKNPFCKTFSSFYPTYQAKMFVNNKKIHLVCHLREEPSTLQCYSTSLTTKY